MKLPLNGNSTLKCGSNCAGGPNGPSWVSIQMLTAVLPPPLLQFLNQENHMSRMQLLEVEARLKSALAALQEHNLQYEELMDSQQRLRYCPPIATSA